MILEKKSHSRLQTLELQGYKTFATKTAFEFAPTITAIVGPNGSGKSNIADAIRWVLGEQAYSLLRGKKTEDMIFSGSDNRSRAGMAAATIRFDNTEGWLPIDFSEVSVGRRAYRDGQNEYLINDQKVRLRDVSELLAESGLAERTYTIIGQGLVDTALSLRAEERRELFEEAAGIGLYRSRREEAVRRLDNTRRNLERVQDILAELRPRLRSLERQAQRARDYEQVKEDLKSSLRVWYGFHWNRMQRVVSQASQAAQKQAEDRRKLHQEQEMVDQELASTRRRIEEMRQQLQTWSGEAGDLYSRRQELGRKEAVLAERLRWLQEQQSLIQAELDSLLSEEATARKSVVVAEEEMQERADAVRQLEEAAVGEGAEGQLTLLDRREREAEINRLRRELEELAGRQAAWSTREAQLTERKAELELALESTREELERAEQEEQRSRVGRDEHRRELERARAAYNTMKKRRNELAAQERSLAQQAEEKQSQLRKLQRRSDQLQSRLIALRELAEGSQAGSQALLKAAERGEVAGVVGRLVSRLKVPREYRRAISTALGELIGGLAVSGRRELEQALEYLGQRSDQARTVLLPVKLEGEDYYIAAEGYDGVLGNAADVVEAGEGLAPILRRLLGRTWIVGDRKRASQLIEELDQDVQLVTRAGELYLPSGVVIVGPPNFGPDRREREELEENFEAVEAQLSQVSTELDQIEVAREEIQSALEELQGQVEKGEEELDERQAQLRQAEIELREASALREGPQRRLRDLQEAQERVQHRWQELLSQGEAFEEKRARLERAMARNQHHAGEIQDGKAVDELEAEWERARATLQEAESRWRERKQRASSLEAEVQTWQDRLDGNLKERESKETELRAVQQEAAEVEGSLSARQAELDPVEEDLRETEGRRAELEKAESRLRFQIQAVENRHSQAQVELARREEELLGLQRRIEDDFGLVAYEYDDSTTGQEPLPLEGLVERLPNVDELPEGIETQVKRLRAQLRRMGSINPEAKEEYVHVRDRMQFMTSQVDDLREAESQMQEVIAELDVIMAREFRTTFEAVALAFKETFQQLFGGGSARLILTDPEDPNESGIEIEARLPGKREQGLAVLSGGERSLAASALIFALLKVSPTPFAVLDEVDAMLDESNVVRFCDLLEELSANTQFIVITHNRETVQVAQAVYGVTMAADSTSRIISLDLEEAAREVAA